jgi:hypothetical protein
VVMLVGCGPDTTALEERIAKLEAGNGRSFARWWCPTAGEPGHCVPESPVAPADLSVAERQRWRDRAPFFAAQECSRQVGQGGTTAVCVSTRLVVCSTHDANELNACFLSWAMCKENLALRPNRRCAAYFDGERVE